MGLAAGYRNPRAVLAWLAAQLRLIAKTVVPWVVQVDKLGEAQARVGKLPLERAYYEDKRHPEDRAYFRNVS
jgi:hypothetical protein